MDCSPRISTGLRTERLEAQICKTYGATQTRQISPADLDDVFQAWREDQSNGRVSDDDIVNCFVCLFGELLRMKFGLEWKIVIDNFGPDLALHILKTDQTWETCPIQFVAKRVESRDDEGRFFSALETWMKHELHNGS
jgi:hypothetical protein